MAYQLLTDSQFSSFLDTYDFYIYPFVNPDGESPKPCTGPV